MCLGAQARAANEQAANDYEYQLKRREQEWNQTLALTHVEHAEYETGMDRSRVYTQNAYATLNQELNDAFGLARQKDEKAWTDFVTNSTSSKLIASGQTGKSVNRAKAIDFATYLKEGSRVNYELTQTKRKIKEASEGIRQKQILNEEQMFSNVMFIKQPGLEPPKPVFQNVGMAMLTDALSIGSSVMGFF